MDTLATSSEDLRGAPVTSNLCQECLEVDCVCNAKLDDLRKPEEKGSTLVVYRDEFDTALIQMDNLKRAITDTRELSMEYTSMFDKQLMVVYERTSTLLVLACVTAPFALISLGLSIYAVIN